MWTCQSGDQSLIKDQGFINPTEDKQIAAPLSKTGFIDNDDLPPATELNEMNQ